MTATISSRPAAARARARRLAALAAVGLAAVASVFGAATHGVSASAAQAHVPLSLQSGSATPRPAGQCSTPSNDLYPGVPWTSTRLGLSRVAALTTGKGVLVAVIDTGVDAAVPQLTGHVLTGYDVVDGSGTANTDCYGHGTFVAGIIAAQPRPGTGVTGVAPGATILPIRQANSANDGTAAGLAQSIRVAADAGAKVINISASSFFPSDDLAAAVQYATAKDVLLVASASNEAQQGNPKAYPAAYPQVVAVGAIGQDGKRTDFSEVGDYLDLVAPGVNIISLSRGGQGHLMDNGTSYAAPFVTGVAALVRASHPHLNAAQVKRRLELTADHPATASLPDPQVGWGVVNPYNAVAEILPEEYGAYPRSATAAPVTVPAPESAPDAHARRSALLFTAGGGIVAMLGAVLAYTLPRGARRHWRAAGEPTATESHEPIVQALRDRLTGARP